MTKRHFELFARLIRESDAEPMIKHYAARVFARLAESDNPRFDRARFCRACGLEEPL